jgi:hypothetical protein
MALVGLTLSLGCEAPRARDAPQAPEAPIPVPLPVVPPAETPVPSVDSVQRDRIQEMLTGYGYVPDAAALKALGPGTLETLSAIANDEGAKPDVRARALASISFLSDPRAATELTQALQDGKSTLLVRTALFGLARVRGSAAVPQIAPFLADSNPTLRLAAVEALGRIGGVAARRALQQRLDGEPDTSVHEALTRALTKPNP